MLLTLSCGRGGASTNPNSTPDEATENIESTESKAASTPVNEAERKTDEYILKRVQQIYDNVFASYKIAEEEETAPQDSPDEKYCSDSWNQLLLKVIDFDQQHNPDDIGFFEADYWVMGQDFKDLSISNKLLTRHDGDEAEVEFDLHNCGSVTHVRLELKYERGNWYIDDFIDTTNDIDWKDEMKDYLKQ